jgi:hypothetical protein
MRPLLLLFPLMAFLAACKPDPCAGVACQNGGTCVNGFCECTDEYTGPSCALPLDPCITKSCPPERSENCLALSPSEARCICRSGFEGDTCQARWEDKFVGSWTCRETCDSILFSFPLQIQAGPEFSRFTLVNFNNQPGAVGPAKIVARLEQAQAFEIQEQFMSFGIVSGFGLWENERRISLSYTIIAGADTLRCQAVLER